MKTIEMPLINVRDIVIYPGMEQSLIIGREFTIKAIQHALKHNRGRIVAVTQKNMENAKPNGKSDIYSVGTICKIEKSILMSDGVMTALLKAEKRVSISKVSEKNEVRHISGSLIKDSAKQRALDPMEKREILELLIRWNPSIALDDDDGRLANLKKETKLDAFLEAVFGLICHRKSAKARDLKKIGTQTPKLSRAELKSRNLGLKKRQVLLEEGNSQRQLKLVKEILKAESC